MWCYCFWRDFRMKGVCIMMNSLFLVKCLRRKLKGHPWTWKSIISTNTIDQSCPEFVQWALDKSSTNINVNDILSYFYVRNFCQHCITELYDILLTKTAVLIFNFFDFLSAYCIVKISLCDVCQMSNTATRWSCMICISK